MKLWKDKIKSREERSTESRRDKSTLSSSCFYGFVTGHLRHLDIQGGLMSRSNRTYDCGVLRPRLIRRPNLMDGESRTQVQCLKFLPGGNRLLCVEIKTVLNNDSLVWNRSLPLSQILILQCTLGHSRRYAGVVSYEFENVSSTIVPEYSYPLEFLTIFCTDLSRNGEFLTICGVDKNNKQHLVAVFRVLIKYNSGPLQGGSPSSLRSQISIMEVAKYKLDGSGVLSAKITACMFSPDSSILVTTVCNDFFLNSRQNFIDFWNFRSNLHVGRLDPAMNYRKCSKLPRGYLSSIAFSSDGNTLILCTSALQVIVYSMSKALFGHEIYNLKYPAVFREDKWQPVYCCVTPPFGNCDFVVCTQDGTVSRLRLNPAGLTVHGVCQSQIFVNQELLNMHVHGVEFCCATTKLLIRVSCDDTVVYDVINNCVTNRLVCSAVSFRDAQNMMSTINASTAVSRNGKEIAICAGETVNVFILPDQHFSLLSLCRDTLVKIVPESDIVDLPLPKCLQLYLLFGKCASS